MGIDLARYHGWQGTPRSPWWSVFALVRVGLIQLFRRKLYWLVLSLGLLNFLFVFAAIFLVTQAQLPVRMQQGILKNIGFAASPEVQSDAGYLRFMESQKLIVGILLAFSGSLLVGADFRFGSIPFFLSRSIDRVHYLFGKLLTVAVIVWLITVVPALVLFVEYGLFTSSFSYWIDNLGVLVGIFGYGLILGGMLSLMLVTLSAYAQKMAPIAIVWSSTFLLLHLVSELLRSSTGDSMWKLLSPWRDMRYAGLIFFTDLDKVADRDLVAPAIGILAVMAVLLLGALVWRVRAVEVVT